MCEITDCADCQMKLLALTENDCEYHPIFWCDKLLAVWAYHFSLRHPSSACHQDHCSRSALAQSVLAFSTICYEIHVGLDNLSNQDLIGRIITPLKSRCVVSECRSFVVIIVEVAEIIESAVVSHLSLGRDKMEPELTC